MEKLGIYKAIAGIIADIGAVGKDKVNKVQGFKYRSVDDVYSVLNPALAKNKVFILPEVLEQNREIRTNKNGTQMACVILKMKYSLYADDGSFIETILLGEAMDTGDKAINKAMAIAYKYLCFQVFCIPVEEMDDPDADRPEMEGKSSSGSKSKQQKTQSKNVAPAQQNGKTEVKETEKNVSEHSHSEPMTEQMLQTILAEMKRTGVTEEVILNRKQLKDKKRKNIKELDISDFKYVMSIFKRTPDKPKGETADE